MEIINEVVEQILEVRLQEINQNNSELLSCKEQFRKNQDDLSRIMQKLETQDKLDLDDYLSMNNYCYAIKLSEIYKSGFTDCIKLFRAIQFIEI